jgi:hypothetical protein
VSLQPLLLEQARSSTRSFQPVDPGEDVRQVGKLELPLQPDVELYHLLMARLEYVPLGVRS